ncbi:ABC transporter ATP-binding protein [Natrinema salifodinae]|uniref:Putative ABC transport system ATP-binding protein n=1 Tax=Natrinema salifodinae TaxID=1202768 RepID=A0A1I0M8S8_9EURY|nr:ABC transporter ATP-binding protein [Natrinema salifodinae]SEV83781.1 putative ABC transport system ATP-binding protein [Natrinema salifodinae]
MAADPPPNANEPATAADAARANADAGTNASAPVTVRCEDVTHEYGDRSGRLRSDPSRSVTALRDASFTARAGEVVGFVGPSGSGKSTALHVVGGLLEPTAGTVDVLGTDLTRLSASERTALRRDRVGFVFQEFHLLPSLTARTNVALPLIERGVARRVRRRRATDLLERVGLADRADHRPSELSGGERQRVAIARALVTDPDLVLADEPTGELDTATGERVLDLLVDVADDRTVLIATHDERAVAVTDRVLRLLDGTVTSGTSDG